MSGRAGLWCLAVGVCAAGGGHLAGQVAAGIGMAHGGCAYWGGRRARKAFSRFSSTAVVGKTGGACSGWASGGAGCRWRLYGRRRLCVLWGAAGKGDGHLLLLRRRCRQNRRHVLGAGIGRGGLPPASVWPASARRVGGGGRAREGTRGEWPIAGVGKTVCACLVRGGDRVCCCVAAGALAPTCAGSVVPVSGVLARKSSVAGSAGDPKGCCPLVVGCAVHRSRKRKTGQRGKKTFGMLQNKAHTPQTPQGLGMVIVPTRLLNSTVGVFRCLVVVHRHQVHLIFVFNCSRRGSKGRRRLRLLRHLGPGATAWRASVGRLGNRS